MSEKFFPSILIVMDVLAAAVYFGDGDWRKVGYWISAAVLTACVTY